MKKLLGIALAFCLLFVFIGDAQAATVKNTFTAAMAENKDIDLTKTYDMLGTDRNKQITLEAGFIQYLVDHDQTLAVKFSNSSQVLRLNGRAFITPEYQALVKSGVAVTVKVKVVSTAASNVYDYFSKAVMNNKGFYCDSASAIQIEAELYADGKISGTYTKFMQPLNITVPYAWSSANNDIFPNSVQPADLRLYYVAGPDKVNDGTPYEWLYVGGSVDVSAKAVSGNVPGPGFYCAVASKTHSGSADDTINQPIATPTDQSVTGFSDMVKHWAESDVAYLQSINVIREKSGLFAPSQNINRAEYCVYLVRLLSLDSDLTAKDKFKDVLPQAAYYNDVVTAASAGLVAGRSEGVFDPAAQITRQEMAAMMSNVMAYKNSLPQVNADTALQGIKDAGQISAWAKASCAQCVEAGLIGGRSGSLFAPKDSTTRAEACAILARLSRYLQ